MRARPRESRAHGLPPNLEGIADELFHPTMTLSVRGGGRGGDQTQSPPRSPISHHSLPATQSRGLVTRGERLEVGETWIRSEVSAV